MEQAPKKPPVPNAGLERDQFDKMVREIKALKVRVDQLERENSSLKKSIYELSTRYSSALHHNPRLGPFIIDPAETAPPPQVLGGKDAIVGESSADLEALTPTSAAENIRRDKHRDGRIFYQKYELKGHTGAVYVVQHSPCGKFLASGSFDKTVRIWDSMSTQKEIACFKKHNLNISDVSWSKDSTLLLSGGYDRTCKVWDVESGKMLASYEVEGFVQCVGFQPQENAVFFCGTSRNVLAAIDFRRDGGPNNPLIMRNDSMVNTLYVHRDGNYVLTGDALGCIKTWDVRVGKCVQSYTNEPTRKPLSHIAVCQSTKGYSEGEEARLIAVNSYDNVIRVYDRGTEPIDTQPKLLHALKGYKNRNWPIKSSFFNGKDYAILRRSGSHEDVYGGPDNTDTTDGRDLDGHKFLLENSTILATGSADPYAYVYSAGGSDGGPAELLQRLEGHTDRVYAVNFHPNEPLLATCSADFSIRIWAANGRVKKK